LRDYLTSGRADVIPEVARDESDLLVVTDNGYGKRTAVSEYRLQGRGGSGIITGNFTVESSTNLATWMPLVTNLLTTNYVGSFSTNNASAEAKFFRIRTQ